LNVLAEYITSKTNHEPASFGIIYYVAKHGGIAAAVAHMPYGIQQPGLSAQIIQLEKSLGKHYFSVALLR